MKKSEKANQEIQKHCGVNTEDQSAGPEPDPTPREAEVMEGSWKLST